MFGFVTLTTNFIITQWSEYLSMLTGLPPGEAVGKNLFQLFPDLKERGIDTAIQHVIETGAPLGLSRILHRYIFPARDGSLTEQSALIHPLTQANQVVGVILNIQDVSDRSQIEMELRNRLRLLEILRDIDQYSMGGDLSTVLQIVVDSASELIHQQPTILCVHDKTLSGYFFSKGHFQNELPEESCAVFEDLRQSKKPIRILNPEQNFTNQPGEKSIQAILAVPLLDDNEVIGGLVVKSEASAFVMGETPEVLKSLAAAAAKAVAVERVRRAQQKRMAELEIIHQVGSILRDVTTRQEIIQRSLDYAIKLVQGGGGGVMMPAKDPHYLQVVEAHNLPEGFSWDYHPIDSSLAGYAFQLNTPIIVKDLMAEYGDKFPFPDEVREMFIRIPSWMMAPFSIGNRVLGLLAVYPSSSKEFTQEDLTLLTTVTDIAAVALERSINLERAERRANQLAILNDLSQKLSNALSVQEVYDFVVDTMVERFGYSIAVVTELDPDTEEMVIRARQTRDPSNQLTVNRFPAGTGITSIVLREGGSLLLNDVSRDPRYVSVTSLPPGSQLCVPIYVAQKIAAALTIEEPYINAFDSSDQDAVMAMAAHVGLALTNIGRVNRIIQTSARIKIVDNAMRQMIQDPTPVSILNLVLHATGEIVPFTKAGLFMVSENQENLMPVKFVGVSPEVRQKMWETPPRLSGGIFAEVMRTHQPYEIKDKSQDGRVVKFDGYTGEELSCYPIVANERVMAIVDFDSVAPDEEARTMLTTLYNRAALALQNAFLYDETVNLVQQRGVLLRISTDLTQILDEGKLFQKVMDGLCQALNLDAAAIGIIAEDPSLVEIQAVLSRLADNPVCEVGISFPVAQTILSEQMLDRSGVIATALGDAHQLNNTLLNYLQDWGVQTMVMASLTASEYPTGVLFGFSVRKPRDFTANELALVQGIAIQAGIALQRIRFLVGGRSSVSFLYP